MLFHPAVRAITRGLFVLCISATLCLPAAAQFATISVGISPPALPIYEQPMVPAPGYLWTPGYWAWSDDYGYYWVPGTWVLAPVGLVWTPGYWAWNDGAYTWNAGYWAPHIGFYGGINYGFGYNGVGYFGGEWRGNTFFYNTAVVNVNSAHITHVYNDRHGLINGGSHVSFNGGKGGVMARPTPQEAAYAREPHRSPLAAQSEQQHAASQNHALFASENHGRPPVAATLKPGQFTGAGVVSAKAAGAPYHAPRLSPSAARASTSRHPAGSPPVNRALTSSNPHRASNNKPTHGSVRGVATARSSHRAITSRAPNIVPQKQVRPRTQPHAHAPHLAAAPHHAPTPTRRAAPPRPVPATHRSPAAHPRAAPAIHRPPAPSKQAAPAHKEPPR